MLAGVVCYALLASCSGTRIYVNTLVGVFLPCPDLANMLVTGQLSKRRSSFRSRIGSRTEVYAQECCRRSGPKN